MEEKTVVIHLKSYSELLDKIERYEETLVEVVEQKNLIDFLDKNEWATSEDYFAHLARKALKE